MGYEAERTLSSAALAAEAADDAPRALITAAPRLATVGMNVSENQAASVITYGGRLAANLGVLVSQDTGCRCGCPRSSCS